MKTLIIDGNNLLFRAYHVSALTDKKGRRVSGIFGTMKMFPILLEKFAADNVVVCWDQGRSKVRLRLYPEYKKKRDENRKPEELEQIEYQRRVCREIFDLLPVRQISVEGVEADDVIGYLCEKIRGEKIVVSNDQDFFQLVKEGTKLFLPNRGTIVTHENVDRVLGFPVKHYILWKSMVGDTSDNIKGIHGIGAKKATAIILNGVTGGKKLPINPEEMKILERNKELIAIGALLQPDEIKQIREIFKQQKNKDVNFFKVKAIFSSHNFDSLFFRFQEWRYHFDKLIRKQNAKGKK